MEIYIVRHGETRANKEGLMQGSIDEPLNDYGIELARITGEGLKGISFDYCISSPLIRARQTAETILKHSENIGVAIETDKRIAEIHMGEWEGKKFRPGESELDPKEVAFFFDHTLESPGAPGGENVYQVMERTQSFLKELAKREGEFERVLVTTHGCAMRSMLNFLYEKPEDFWHGHVPYNLAVNVVEVKGGILRHTVDDRIYYDLNWCQDHYANYK